MTPSDVCNAIKFCDAVAHALPWGVIGAVVAGSEANGSPAGLTGVPDGGIRQVSLKRSRLHLRPPCPCHRELGGRIGSPGPHNPGLSSFRAGWSAIDERRKTGAV